MNTPMQLVSYAEKHFQNANLVVLHGIDNYALARKVRFSTTNVSLFAAVYLSKTTQIMKNDIMQRS